MISSIDALSKMSKLCWIILQAKVKLLSLKIRIHSRIMYRKLKREINNIKLIDIRNIKDIKNMRNIKNIKSTIDTKNTRDMKNMRGMKGTRNM